ncbi:hypothetical protein B0T18DRAFT_439395 [Schizothecium vesticola]|uniref:CorA-like transporter domain-containing protein n=1 Tax=Schizothecium vesticola TaxID=314040 RepID=A0AA40EQA9_9PEZI|nr:hypothetical protein B0T18DRAFT_439395 [Schizothecium vesticola]
MLSYYQVMPCFPDFLYSFGPKNGEERESSRFSGFRTEKTLQSIKPALVIPALNRSGKRYQLCCTLKSTSRVWRIRSAVVYHQFDVDCGTQLWIIGDPIQGIQELVREHIHEKKNHKDKFDTPLQSFKTSLQMLLHYLQWATEDWRWRVQSAEEELQEISYVTISLDRHVDWDKTGMLVIQKHIDHLTDTLTCIESNVAITNRFQSFYTDLVDDPAWPQADIVAYKHAVKEFVSQLGEHLYDLSMQLKRANLALQIGKDRKDILIQHLSAQNAAKQEEYTKVMWRQQHKTGLDAVAMKVITVITLVYLPMTFVSTFFSTDVVKYQPDDSGYRPSASGTSTGGDAAAAQEKLSRLALERFFEISIPLMAVTFACAVGWYRWETYRIKKRVSVYEKDFEV